jgi:hypothetical protein
MPAKAVVIFGPGGAPLVNAEAKLVKLPTNGLSNEFLFPLTNQDGYSNIPISLPQGDYYFKVCATNFKNYLQLVTLDSDNQEIHVNAPGGPPNTIHLPSLSFNKPSRARIIRVMANLCNIYDATGLPIFEPMINQLILTDKNRADDWVARLKDAGSTHITTDITGDYDEYLPWLGGRYPIPGGDYTKNLDDFKRILDYLLSADLIPIIKSGADGQGYSAGGMTYGWQWGINNLPLIYSQLKDYHDQCLWSTSYDGGFADWSPDQLLQFLKMMRGSLGADACIDAEFSGSGSISYIHLGNGAADWTSDKLGDLDCFSLELQVYPEDNEGLNEVAQRLLEPESSVYYLSKVTKDINISMYETTAYWSIRKYVSPEQNVQQANRIKKLGYYSFGNGVPQ